MTVVDNPVPELDKIFRVELYDPEGGGENVEFKTTNVSRVSVFSSIFPLTPMCSCVLPWTQTTSLPFVSFWSLFWCDYAVLCHFA